MTSASEAVIGKRRDFLAILIVLPIIFWEVYLIWFGSMIQAVQESPSVLLFLAFINALGAAWSVVDLEYFPKWGAVRRKTRIWLAIGVNLGCAGLILLWLVPRFAPHIIIFLFGIADTLAFLTARDLFSRTPLNARR